MLRIYSYSLRARNQKAPNENFTTPNLSRIRGQRMNSEQSEQRTANTPNDYTITTSFHRQISNMFKAILLLTNVLVLWSNAFCPNPNTSLQRIFSTGSLQGSLASQNTSTQSSTSPSSIKTPIVQRYHETYRWTNPSSKITHNINYKAEGDISNPPILLVHGFGANVNHFRFQFPELTKAGYRVYAVDLLGFGGSDKSKDEEYSIDLWVDLLSDFMDYADDHIHKNMNQQWVVAGNSIGGLCSLAVAARKKEQVRGVTLFNCAGGMSIFRYEDPVPIFLRPILWFVQKIILSQNGYGTKFFEDFKTRENVESILKNQGVYVDTTNVDEELLEILLGPSDDEGAKEVFLKVFGGDAGPAPEKLLPQVKQPILAIWGESDPWTPVDNGFHPGNKFYQYANGPFDLRVIKGCGHCPQDEAPEAVHAEMIPWLSNL